MKILFDFLPILLFFIAYKIYDIYVATAVIIVASIAQVGLFWLKHHRVEKMHLITLVLVVILGGATIFLHNPLFIYWKPTIVNWLFALVFLGSQFIGQKNVLQRMLEEQITLTSQAVWLRLNMAWVAFFIVMGAVNLYVAFNFEENTWVNFKLFGMMGLTIVFVIGQSLYLAQYIMPEDDETPIKKAQPERSSIDV
ncbi:MAG: septation protein A [Gammaproteobacteria bacterium]|nr:MAG: septation protein A [Gammaproteobacteria bacterium]RKZ72614.1 MAG: septation protein A [Gammaproteobacteria bacterium]